MMLLAVKPLGRWLGLVLAVGFGFGLVLLILWAVVVVPPSLIDVHDIQDPAKRLEEINGLRTTLAAVLGGLAVMSGAAVGALNFRETSRQNRAALDLQRRGQVTERFTRAIEQLGQAGPDKLDVRIGAVYALEQIARDSADLHWPIMEVLTAYLRGHAPSSPPPFATTGPEREVWEQRTPADHQAIATVLGRRQPSQDPADQRLDLQRVDLQYVMWTEAQLEGADLRGAQLEDANLRRARLKGARLQTTKLTRAYLRGAQLESANLRRAQLEDAVLISAQLERANLYGAQLRGANLREAQLNGADLREADLEAANIEGADLTQVQGLTWPQLHLAKNVDRSRLPAYLGEEPGEHERSGPDLAAGGANTEG
ncbi:MAG TPA: pentapeptide repeat-containing protein [Candidatus Dormibacteraeota bacterium]|nr:pentapeptide repeat-containing protein [Candidatus Dormibacteraeota bacterium]